MVIIPAEHINRKPPKNYKEGELDFCKAEFSYDTDAIERLTFKKAYVSFNGLVYNAAYQLVEAAVIDPEHFQKPSRFRHFKKVILKKKRKLCTAEQYLFCFDEWTSNHYHWICDFLPRLAVIASEISQYTLLLPDTAYIKNVGVKLLAYFNLHPKQIAWIKPNETVTATNLTLISHTVLSGRIHDRLMQQVQSGMKDTTLLSRASATRRIYISRSKAAYRKVLNENAVISTVKEYGFEVINFEDLSTEEQIKLAHETAILVSIHGAGLTNTIFMQPGTSVLEFKRSRIYHNQCYWHLSSAMRLQYNYLFGEPDDDNKVLEGIGCNLTIPINTLRTTLETIISQLAVQNK